MTSIGFISTYFSVLPWMLIGIGVVAFLVSAFGLIVSATEVKELLIGYAATMAIICIGLFGKVHIFWEGHKILRNLPLTFDYSTYSQKLGEDFAKFCGLLKIYEL